MVMLALVVAVAVVVPLGTRFLDGRVHRAALVAAAVFAIGALAEPPGLRAALYAWPWLVFAIYVKVAELQAWWRDPHLGWCALGRLAAAGYLVAGAGWLVLARAGVEPMGIDDRYVALTAVHFHFAGFGASLLVALAAEWRHVPNAAALAVIGGPLVVAGGFVVRPELQLVGALVIAAGLGTIAALSWPDGNAYVRASACCVFAGMALAVHWAGGVVLNRWPPLDIDVMARLHGTLNGFGFVVLGLVGRLREVRELVALDGVGEGLAGDEASQFLQRDLGQALQLDTGGAGHVRREHDVRELPQR